jgi:transposase
MNILDLPNWQVRGKPQETQHDILITAEPLPKLSICLHCGHDKLLKFGVRSQVYQHTPFHGKRLGILVHRQRFKCPNCKRLLLQPLSEIDEKRRMTTSLRAYIEAQALSRRTFTDIAQEVGVNERTVRRAAVEIRGIEPFEHFETPEWLGINEIMIGRTLRVILTNIKQKTLYDLLPSRKEEYVARYLYGMPVRQRVRVVVIEMLQSYKAVIETIFPEAHIIIDKLQVMTMANAALDRIRKELERDLSTSDRRKLMQNRFILLKRKEQLSEEEQWKLDLWKTNFAVLGRAHEVKEAFYAIYDAKSRAEAAKLLYQWRDEMPTELKVAFKGLLTVTQNWETEILNFFEYDLDNSFADNMSGRIRKVERQGRGYSFKVLRKKVLNNFGLVTGSRPPFQHEGWNLERAMMIEMPHAIIYGVPFSTFLDTWERGEL